MNTLTFDNKKKTKYLLFILSSFFLYVIMTGAKNLYVAEKTTFSSVAGIGSLTQLAMTMEYYFYAYAVAQIILIFFIKKINVKWFLAVTLSASAVLTGAIAFTDSIIQHYWIYIANGFLQAGIWGSLFKLFGEVLPSSYLPLANKLMAAGPAVAGIVSYGFAAMFGDAWRSPFIALGIILLAAVFLYFISASSVTKINGKDCLDSNIGANIELSDEDNDFIHLDSRLRVSLFYVVAAVMSFFVTSLFFMLNNNVDVFFKEIGGFSNDLSKLLSILVPITIVLGPMFTVSSCEKHKNFILVGAVYFGIAAALSLLLVFFYDAHLIISLVLLLAFLVVCNGARMITMSIISLRMRKKINTGVLSVSLNVTASIASGVAPRIIASILDNESLGTLESWQTSFLLIFFLNLAIVAAILLIELWVYLINRKKKSA